MALVIQTNVASLQAQKNLSTAQSSLGTSFNRLSSGNRINSAKDDAAGLAISESMKNQVRSYTVAERNANDAVSMAQTAEGALGEVSNILGRMRELAVQGANGSLQSADRAYLKTEFTQMQAEVKRILTSTKFNGRQLVASGGSSVTFQVGLNNSSDDQISVSFGGVNLKAVTSTSTSVSGAATGSQNALATIDSALSTVSTARARFGAAMNRFEVTTSNIQTARLNIAASASRIKDVDVAEEAASLSKNQVLTQAATSVLAQANSSPQSALMLIR
jgi:flagellin